MSRTEGKHGERSGGDIGRLIMKKSIPYAPDVAQNVANKAVRIIERHLRRARVTRARDLSQEGKLRLAQEVRVYLAGTPTYCGLYPIREAPEPGRPRPWRQRLKLFFINLWEKDEDFLTS